MKKAMLIIIKSYQKIISKSVLGKTFLKNTCRFSPTCSDYTYKAVLKYGTIKGLLLGFARLLRCHPLFKGGYDPVR